MNEVMSALVVGWLCVPSYHVVLCFTALHCASLRYGVCVPRVNVCLDEDRGWDGGDCCENTCISTKRFTCGSKNYFCLDPSEEQTPYASCVGVGIGTWIADGVCGDDNNNEGKWY